MDNETSKNYVTSLLTQAGEALGFDLSTASVTVPEPAFGDFATNAALALAKREKKNPKEIASSIITELEKLDTAHNFQSIEEKAGFINIRLSEQFLVKNMERILQQGQLYGYSIAGEGRVVVVEYFQNNVAKPPHVGHLRSAVLGDALLRIFKSQGYQTVSDTHIGDWGVQFGILLYAYKTMGKKDVIEQDPINELNKLYVAMSAKIESEPELREKGKEEFVKLEQGDTENRELWQWFVRVSLEDFERYRQLLHLLPFDHNLGESFYMDKIPAVLSELESKGLVSTGETGEKYVDLEAEGLGRCILVKSDGGTTYHLRDFATYLYRKKQFNFFKNLYVVDNRQSHHFRQLFKVLELAGYPTPQDSEHIDLGFMSLPEGAISTRKGTTISLQNLIDEAQKRALAIIDAKNPGLENKEAVAEMVALAAIKYFDLSHNRNTEIVFTWDKALSFEGNTGPYLQYTHARIHGILRKFQITNGKFQTNPETQRHKNIHPLELAVIRKLSQYPDVVRQVTDDCLPNQLCNYLFELSQDFNSFYQEVPVLQEPDAQARDFRLQLISATAQVINNGLYLLGIEAPEQM